jgi:3-dehydroquinate synthase
MEQKKTTTIVYDQSITVNYNYKIYFSEKIFDSGNILFRNIFDTGTSSASRVLFLIEKNVADSDDRLCESISAYSEKFSDVINMTSPPKVISGGESLKSRDTISDLCALMAENALCRQSFVVIIGGGAFLDTVGFAASIVHRGIRQVRVPTTVLAQNDSGVGVKTAVNMHGIKNFLGTFAPPYAVVNDFSLLATLPLRDWVAGAAEAFKVAMIKDAVFFEWLSQNVEKIASRDKSTMRYLIQRCAELHLEHIATSGDPFEFGSARPLDFGHWAAHKLEMLTDGEMRHGEAVAIGLMIDTFYAVKMKYIEDSVLNTLVSSFSSLGMPLFHEKLLPDAEGNYSILSGIEEFREHLGGQLHITLPDGIGRKLEVNFLDENIIRQAIDFLGSL